MRFFIAALITLILCLPISVKAFIPIDQSQSHSAVGTSQNDWGYRKHPIRKNPDGSPRYLIHKGVDICQGCATGTPVGARISGTVVRSDNRDPNGYGNRVCIQNSSTKVCSSHLNSRNVRVGQQVNIGDNLGGVGTTGGSTGNHVDEQVYLKNPATGRFHNVDPIMVSDAVRAGLDTTDPAVMADIIARSDQKLAEEEAYLKEHGLLPDNVTRPGELVGGPAGQQCSPENLSIADQLANLYKNQANQSLSDIITQPTSVAQMSCLDQLSAKYSSEISSKFMNDVGLGGGAVYPDFVQDTFLGVVADNFMGGALSGIQEAINGAISNTISGVANAILPGVGGGLGNLLGGGTDFDCKIMKTIWDLVQCAEFPEIPKLFDLDFGGSFLSRPDSCVGQALYDGAIDTLNSSGAASGLKAFSAGQSQELNKAIRCSIGSGTDCPKPKERCRNITGICDGVAHF